MVVPAFYIAEQHPVLFWGAVLGAMFFIAWGIDRIGWVRRSDDGLGETFMLVLIVTACLWWVWAVVAFLVSIFLDIHIEPY